MGCGASKFLPDATSVNVAQQHTGVDQNKTFDTPRKENLPVANHNNSPQRIQEGIHTSSAGWQGAAGAEGTNGTVAVGLESDAGNLVSGKVKGDDQQRGAWTASTEGNVAAPLMETNAGKVSAKVKSIVNQEDEDEFGASETDLDVVPISNGDNRNHAPQGGTFLMQGAAKIDKSGTNNPISDSFGDGDVSIQSQMKPAKAAAQRKVEDHAFTSIAPTGSLPSLSSFQRRAEPDWLVASALDHLGEETPTSKSRSGAGDAQKLQGPDDVLVLQDGISQDDEEEEEEEDDAFDMNGISAPTFQHEAQISNPPTVSKLAEAADELDPDDPWASLQSQYRIKEDMGSPSVSGRKEYRKPSGAGVRTGHSEWGGAMGPDEELVLDIDGVGAAAPARQTAVSTKQARKGVPVRGSAGPKEASWGRGEMARAGDIMLGPGALDVDDTDFNGQLDALYAADGYEPSEHSIDVSAPEVPMVHPNSADMAMEDFIEEIETYGGKTSGDKAPSLADKLAHFEAGFDEDEDLMIQEELRIMSQNNA